MSGIYDFGLILQSLRKEKGMTQEQLATRIHKESSVISRYENNLQSPTFETVRAFAAIFNVSMDYLSGMEKGDTISTSGLSSEQIIILKNIADVMRQGNSDSQSTVTDEQYLLIGKLIAQIIKSMPLA